MSREAMKLALEALKNFEKAGLATLKTIDAIIALKQALEQPEPEPVAWTLLLVGENAGIIGKAGETFESHPKYYKRVDVYTSPPKREPPCKTGSQCTTKCMECAEPEPVAEVRCDDGGNLTAKFHVRDLPLFAPLYTSPPKREWQKLTDEEIDEGQRHSWVEKQAFESAVWWAEAKLKEKNT